MEKWTAIIFLIMLSSMIQASGPPSPHSPRGAISNPPSPRRKKNVRQEIDARYDALAGSGSQNSHGDRREEFEGWPVIQPNIAPQNQAVQNGVQDDDEMTCTDCCKKGPLFWSVYCNVCCCMAEENITCWFPCHTQGCDECGQSCISCCQPFLSCIWPCSDSSNSE